MVAKPARIGTAPWMRKIHRQPWVAGPDESSSNQGMWSISPEMGEPIRTETGMAAMNVATALARARAGNHSAR
jgi:hypothetical protein